jgi:AcrR family transcriptional regulator
MGDTLCEHVHFLESPVRVTGEVKQATEKAIRASARRLFVRKGFEATSTREIAVAAKVAVGTLFNYFPSKEALAVALAAEAFAAGRAEALRRMASEGSRRGSVEEDLFMLVAADIRALEPVRSFIGEVLETGLSPFAAGPTPDEAAGIRTDRLADAAAALARRGLGDAATGPVMHLYWSLYLGVLSFWAVDRSPKQEDTWALLDQSVRMFAGALRRAGVAEVPARTDVAEGRIASSILGDGPAVAAEIKP